MCDAAIHRLEFIRRPATAVGVPHMTGPAPDKARLAMSALILTLPDQRGQSTCISRIKFLSLICAYKESRAPAAIDEMAQACPRDAR